MRRTTGARRTAPQFLKEAAIGWTGFDGPMVKNLGRHCHRHRPDSNLRKNRASETRGANNKEKTSREVSLGKFSVTV